MTEIFGDNMIFYTSAEITNKGIGKTRNAKKTKIMIMFLL
jgi:hypothetical protein